MNRRGFLAALGTFAAAAVLDPEKLLWVPGQKKIFIPAPPPKEATLQVYCWSDVPADPEEFRRAALEMAEGHWKWTELALAV